MDASRRFAIAQRKQRVQMVDSKSPSWLLVSFGMLSIALLFCDLTRANSLAGLASSDNSNNLNWPQSQPQDDDSLAKGQTTDLRSLLLAAASRSRRTARGGSFARGGQPALLVPAAGGFQLDLDSLLSSDEDAGRLGRAYKPKIMSTARGFGKRASQVPVSWIPIWRSRTRAEESCAKSQSTQGHDNSAPRQRRQLTVTPLGSHSSSTKIGPLGPKPTSNSNHRSMWVSHANSTNWLRFIWFNWIQSQSNRIDCAHRRATCSLWFPHSNKHKPDKPNKRIHSASLSLRNQKRKFAFRPINSATAIRVRARTLGASFRFAAPRRTKVNEWASLERALWVRVKRENRRRPGAKSNKRTN